MDGRSFSADSPLERLTAAAEQAAGEGRWDVVDRCYREREPQLRGLSLSPQEAERLRARDRRIEERASLAQAALASLMRDAAAIRQRLKGLRQGQGAQSSESGMILLEA
jgi:hypothetical protein